jgi:hypothetical protein
VFVLVYLLSLSSSELHNSHLALPVSVNQSASVNFVCYTGWFIRRSPRINNCKSRNNLPMETNHTLVDVKVIRLQNIVTWRECDYKRFLDWWLHLLERAVSIF